MGQGGGVYTCNLTNCTVRGNYAFFQGGTYSDFPPNQNTYVNCIIYYNSSSSSNPNYSGGIFKSCCTTPLPSGATGNFTNEPIFLDFACHLQTNSPCIDAGDSSLAVGSIDLDGRPRIVGAAVDIGAMEFQGADKESFILWLAQYGLPEDGTADNTDWDGDSVSNYAEWKSGTNPTNAASVLQLATPTNSLSGMVVTWQSTTNITYYLQRSSDLSGGFSSIVSNLVGQAVNTSYTDTTATNDGPYFYRVGVQ